MKTAITICLLFISSIGFSQSESFTNKLGKMMELNGSERIFAMMVTNMIDNMKQMDTDVSEEMWRELEMEFLTVSLSELTNMMAPIYAEHLTEKDLDAILEFYESPVGKKMNEKLPLISQQAMSVGEAWGRKIGEDLARRMQERGF